MTLKKILPGRLGFGTAPLGNMFRAIPDEEAAATVEAAWDQGVRYFDTAPFYGAGLSETRLGEVLSTRPRDEYVLSTKVGRVI
ncbi:aldo/keto reductase, partial [Kitasatospora griseola]|uniref:aldo/keto reductase n=1 Tax=Kitasatospora griseola TaxID=2064 RepID=UPI0036DBBCA7